MKEIYKPTKALIVSILLCCLFLIGGLVLLKYYYTTYIFPFKTIEIHKRAGIESEVYIEALVPLKTKIEYGTSEEFFIGTNVTDEYSTHQTLTVSGLIPNKLHYYKVLGWDKKGTKYESKVFSY